jgi:hypothetical protein
MVMKLTRVGTLVLIMAAAHADDKFPKCFNASREGHCSAVQVNGQRSVRLTRNTKKMLEGLGGLKFGQFETSAVVTQADVVQGNRLPPGKYLLQIRLSGSKQNWEQQTLFIQVVE